MKVCVIGAGPAGLAAAYVLAKHRRPVEVFEAADQVGGMSRSLRLWGQMVDLGPHRFFSSNERVKQLWLEVVGHDYAIVNRQTRILYRGKLFNYPLEPLDVLTKLGPVESFRCIFSYVAARSKNRNQAETFEQWVCNRFGRRLFETFFKAYSEKLWGVSCNELDADFAAQRIREFSLPAAIKSALFPSERRKHRTLADQFAYPLNGTGAVYERMAKAIQNWGGHVRMQSPVRKVIVELDRVVGIELATGEQLGCDHVISTMPITDLVRGLSGAPQELIQASKEFAFRNTILVYLEVPGTNPFPDQWIYVHSPEVKFGRVTNFRNWVPQLCGQSAGTILAMEYWCSFGDELWGLDDNALINLASMELIRGGLVGHASMLARGFVFRIPNSYPVYKSGYRKSIEVVKSYLARVSGLQVIGRAGAFKYNNQDHSILMGVLAAENLLSDKKHDLWTINAGHDTYQEAAEISMTSLAAPNTVPMNKSREVGAFLFTPSEPSAIASVNSYEPR